MQRTSVWVRVVLGWLPVAVLLITLILAMHQPTTVRSAAFVGVRLMLLAAVLGVAVARLCSRLPVAASIPGVVHRHTRPAVVRLCHRMAGHEPRI